MTTRYLTLVYWHVMHITMFSTRGREGGGGITHGITHFWKKWNLNPYPCDTILCQKCPGWVIKFLQGCVAETYKVPPLCQSNLSNSWRQCLFWLSNPQGIPPRWVDTDSHVNIMFSIEMSTLKTIKPI